MPRAKAAGVQYIAVVEPPLQPAQPRTPESVDPCEIARTAMAEHGLALEFATASKLSTLGWIASMAMMIPGTDGELRDCDVLARQCFLPTNGGRVKKAGCLLVECKYIPKGKVWCLLGARPVHEPKAPPSYIPHAASERCVWNPVQFRPGRAASSPGGIMLSHGVLELPLRSNEEKKQKEGEQPRDKGYATLSKVVDLAWSHARKSKPAGGMGEPDPSFVVPCIVLKGPLVEAAWNDEEKRLDYRQVEMGSVFWSGKPAPTRIDLVTIDGLDRYAAQMADAIEKWCFYQPPLRQRGAIKKRRTHVEPPSSL